MGGGGPENAARVPPGAGEPPDAADVDEEAEGDDRIDSVSRQKTSGTFEADLCILLLRYVVEHRDMVALVQIEGFLLSTLHHENDMARARIRRAVFDYFSAQVNIAVSSCNGLVTEHQLWTVMFVAKVAFSLYPTNDRRHPIVTPLYLVVEHY